MADEKRIVVFVHGWSVTNTNTYGGLPERLSHEARAAGIDVSINEIFLGRYVSFRDEVRLEDVSRAFEAAVRRQLATLVRRHGRFVCITHSTGGPVVRDWWKRHYVDPPRSGPCPMSHLVMLAPANFGSALAQLGKSRIGRLKSWFGGVEPGEGVLDWLELGSAGGWDLNTAWIEGRAGAIGPKGVFPFVLSGQTIDRKLYDNLNTYTGESGSDGVVRVAAANLNAAAVRLEQVEPRKVRGGRRDRYEAPKLEHGPPVAAPPTAMYVVPKAAHSGTSKGIMRSVRAKAGSTRGAATVGAILECMRVTTPREYERLRTRFAADTESVQADERIEVEDRLLLPDTVFVHDRYAMVVFRLRDEAGHPVTDFDLLLTAGPTNDPNRLPRGFFLDRQANRKSPNTITYFLNYDVMVGYAAVEHKGRVVRPASPGAKELGFRITPRPDEGFVHYLPCELSATAAMLEHVVRPNQTTLVDVVLKRVVRQGVFRLGRGKSTGSFKKDPPGPPIA